MHPWAQALLVACAAVLTGALVAALLAARRAAARAERVLSIVEQELRPLIARAHALADEGQGLTRQAALEVKRAGEALERVNALADGVGRIVAGLLSLTRVGQVIGIAAGLRRGVRVFAHRLRR
jgi:hypothetical protein